MNILTIVQARSGSSRLPGKILKTICDKTILELQLERMLKSKYAGKIIVATTRDKSDDIIESLCDNIDLECFRGHTTDLLDRHYKASLQYNPDAVVKIPSDCPLIDHRIIDKVISEFISSYPDYDYVSNLHPASYPDGNDVEIMKFSVLQTAWKEAEKDYEFEHTTPYLWERPEKFKIKNIIWENGLDFSMTHRFTIDYEEDYIFIKQIFEHLYYHNPDFSLEDILILLNEKPELTEINKYYNGVNWYRNHIHELRTISDDQTKIV